MPTNHSFLAPIVALALLLVSTPAEGGSPRTASAAASVRARYAALEQQFGAAYTEDDGVGLRRAGIALTALGGGALAFGIPFLAVGFGRDDLPVADVLLGVANYLVVPGVVSIAVGIPLLVKGTRRRDRYRQWLDEQDRQRHLSRTPPRLTPLLRPSRGGLFLGLSLRF
ncbi:hypothetical protein [Nannocystis bainbridge]|uniref:Uncharacterized protein n=1 Tax=Nannocystis bainbridge TaxID=2995303 RepID=A0ABT5DUN1_9BACT|nr:hypothetical protein [Nannocystis bainbridge]MDC0716132.1 hypothetical protein [Nannocystis bainbridge]